MRSKKEPHLTKKARQLKFPERGQKSDEALVMAVKVANAALESAVRDAEAAGLRFQYRAGNLIFDRVDCMVFRPVGVTTG